MEAQMSEKKLTIAEIEAQIKQLQAEIVSRKANARTELRADMDKMLADAGLSIGDVYPELVKSAKGKVKAKAKGKSSGTGTVQSAYKDPRSGATWAGRGRAPKWVTELCDEKGMNLQTFKASSEYRA
jgi:DNA-binding protein H-NS